MSQQLIQEAPLHLNSEQYHLMVAKPEQQLIQLPPQHVQPTTTQVVQVPVVSHQTETVNQIHGPVAPAVSVVPTSVLPSVSYGIGAVSSLGYGQAYGQSYGQGYGQAYGQEYESSFLSEYGCKVGECEIMKKDADGHDYTVSSSPQVSSLAYSNSPSMYSNYAPIQIPQSRHVFSYWNQYPNFYNRQTGSERIPTAQDNEFFYPENQLSEVTVQRDEMFN